MRRDELEELHYITPISNVASILIHGILSHRRTAKLQHESVAMPDIQDRRRIVVVPPGRPLHEYVNLYICARNPMLYKRRGQHSTLTVLRIHTDVLDITGAAIADSNASSGYARFSSSPDGLTLIDRSLVFATYWTHPEDEIAEWRHKAAKCAEVLIPDRVPPRYITGAYVSCEEARDTLASAAPDIEITLNARLFFR
jgi:hypothetical protein